jgi:hypothetical protein
MVETKYVVYLYAAKLMQTVTLRYNVNDIKRCIEICLLDKLLKEPSWWKTQSSSPVSQSSVSV